MRIIVTGGCGFIGTHIIKKLINKNNNIIMNIDALKYCSMPESLLSYKFKKNYIFKKIDLNNYKILNKSIKDFKPQLIFHAAAESHVDNSISDPDPFLSSNIIGTYNLLKIINNSNFKNKIKFLHISTDEVYGSLKNNKINSFLENSKFKPNSPYSASKACSDLLVRAWNKTFNIQTIITNCVNNFGPWQFPEKLIPVVINACLNDSKIPVYGSGKNIREWIYVNDHVDCLIALSKKGKIGETYNIGSGYELSNLSLIKKICKYMDKKFPLKKPYYKLVKFVSDRPAHDFRYSLNTKKINKVIKMKKLNNFDKHLEITIDWYLKNYQWMTNKLKNKSV